LADDRRLFVQTGPPTLAVVETTAPAGTLAVDDLTDERAPRRLGQVRGDMTPFVVAVGGRRLLVLAGTHGPSPEAEHVTVDELPGGRQRCPVRNGVWMTFPEPFTDGMTVTVTWRDAAGGALWSAEAGPLDERALGPGWVGFASSE
jgi:hypothetical protein